MLKGGILNVNNSFKNISPIIRHVLLVLVIFAAPPALSSNTLPLSEGFFCLERFNFNLKVSFQLLIHRPPNKHI